MEPLPPPDLATLDRDHLTPERALVPHLLEQFTWSHATRQRVKQRARELVLAVRAADTTQHPLQALLREYDLGCEEGVILMCLAEALLRIPDRATVDRLIHDKLGGGHWEQHLGSGRGWLVNASTWGLLLTGRVAKLETLARHDDATLFQRLTGKLAAVGGEPVVRTALSSAMALLGNHFVRGRDIHEAIKRGRADAKRGYRHSFDMLGEAALTRGDANRFFEAYCEAIDALGAEGHGGPIATAPEVSIKLSALHPRYEFRQWGRVMDELAPRLLTLARHARAMGVGITVDAEESDRLSLMIALFERVYLAPELAGWAGFGLALQAYLKRAPAVLDHLAALAGRGGRPIPLRLVKGAYWDSEIKRAQLRGLDDYPVFTRQQSTELCYLLCAQRMFEAPEHFTPRFATHNAYTAAALLELAGDREVEFQRLHGMGEALHDALRGLGRASRIYAPVGVHRELLPYLVRRLLENGSNSGFINRITDPEVPLEALVVDPTERLAERESPTNPRIPPPPRLYGEERPNAAGFEWSDPAGGTATREAMTLAAEREWRASPLVGGEPVEGKERPLFAPADRRHEVGRVTEANKTTLEHAVTLAHQHFPEWSTTPTEIRAACLERAADLLEARRAEFLHLLTREAGKGLEESLAEFRETVDYARYYALHARRLGETIELPGPTGERNTLRWRGRGVFSCISPWNFPLAIFGGQLMAALAMGNTVVAKPAHQTPLIAAALVRLLHEAGIPGDALHLLPGSSRHLAEGLIGDPRINGVAFTGSTTAAKWIQRRLAERDGAITPLIAETGGQNALIADSSALPEQLVHDIIESAFGAAGQRCSALRVLFVQQEIAPRVERMLVGAMAELVVGDPADPATDIGPVIDQEALARLEAHADRMEEEGERVAVTPLDEATTRYGSFFTPRAYRIEHLEQLTDEVFGPILHIIHYRAKRLEAVIEAINATGFGLTCGVHSRIEGRAEAIAERIRAGNLYINRHITGAVPGVQPFGGEGLSGTGFKAGGPHYLQRFAVEQSVSLNSAAIGGNPTLLSGADEP